MKRRIIQITPILLSFILLSGCATLQYKWEHATEAERARIVLSQFQKSLTTMFRVGSAYAERNPQFAPEWKGKILPSISAANKILGDLIRRGQLGEAITVGQVLSVMGGRISEISAALTAWGVKV